MAKREDQFSVYIPQDKRDINLVERMEKLAEKYDRSVNYLVVQAITEFLEREEN